MQEVPETLIGYEWIVDSYIFLSKQRNINGFIDYSILRNYAKDNNFEVNLLSKYIFGIDDKMRGENGKSDECKNRD